MFKRFCLIACVGFGISGCAPKEKPLYYWGNFQEQLKKTWAQNGSDTKKQIDAMEKDVQKAQSQHEALPPGFHAHLGFLYYHAGNIDAAIKAFSQEKDLFPESATYMSFVLAHLKK